MSEVTWGVYTDGTLRLLEKTLNWRARNQEIIAGNIANLYPELHQERDEL